MSLLNVYVIIAYYIKAVKNNKYYNKITNQRFDIEYIKSNLQCLKKYQSSALHWNAEQVKQISNVAKMALKAYKKISNELGVEMN